jgi:Tfp pilus assembly protein PilO
MKLNWQSLKRLLQVGVGLILLLDLGLVVALWEATREDRGDMVAQRSRLATEARLLRADVARGERIRASLPQAGKDCDAFYRQSFLDVSTGYSQVESDLDAIAQKAGVKTTGFAFKQKDVKDRGVTEISITTGVSADYPQMIQFINGLERSKNFYLLDSLQLASAAPGAIRLQLALHTYFRT